METEIGRHAAELCATEGRMPAKLKEKVYKTVIRPAMLYEAETRPTTKRQEKRIEVNIQKPCRCIKLDEPATAVTAVTVDRQRPSGMATT